MMQRLRFALAVALGLLSAGSALAACPLPNTTLPDADIDKYLSNPGSLLERYPNGGPSLASDVRILAADPERHRAIATMIREARPPQARSIGEGLASAAAACQRLHAETAKRIGQIAMGSGSQTVALAYRMAIGEDAPVTLPSTQGSITPGLPSIGDVNTNDRGFSTALRGQQPGRGLGGSSGTTAAPRKSIFDLSDPFAPVELGK
jgi:hypothetical protein